MPQPKTETWYVWREHVICEGETEPRLVVPWSDPMEYEYAATNYFETPEQAEAWRAEFALEIDEDAKNWVLTRLTLAPVGDLEAHPEQESLERNLGATLIAFIESQDVASMDSIANVVTQYVQDGVLDGLDGHAIGYFEGVAAATGKTLNEVIMQAANAAEAIR